ncbi:Rgp1-domain-containing protein [Amylocystis lapponica]|nr:Rgp1-domain-containing protein [Amylocystis lapponica]
MSDTVTLEDAIRVVVTPSQASYFAGEPFSVTITFTNTRTPDPKPPRSSSHSLSATHKRSAHSISSVPLSRPPTSPGTPRTALPNPSARNAGGDKVSTRKGLIGRVQRSKGVTDLPQPVDLTKKRLMAKSLSISIVTSEYEESGKGKSPVRSLITADANYPTPTSPRISSPLARSAAFPIAPTHPHARKQSVLDAQLQLQDIRSPSSVSPPTPSASSSSFSLSLDTITESASSPIPPTPAVPSPNIATEPANVRTQIPSSLNDSIHHVRPPRRPPQIGHGPPPGSQLSSSRTAFSSPYSASNTELILYSYAQLVGSLSITPAPGSTSTPEQAHALHHLRASLSKRQVVGGGSMDISSSLSGAPLGHGPPPGPTRRNSHSRSASLFSLLSPTALLQPTPTPWTPSHRPQSPSMRAIFSSVPTGSGGGVGLGLGAGVGGEEEVDPELPLPIFEVQPAMLAVDLSLAPGESRSYNYTVVLPENLPPTYRGRTLRFSYQFILGVCRAASTRSASGMGPSGANSRSRIMKVPIRIYNNVTVGRPPKPYDLLWPVTFWKTRGAQCCARVTEEQRLITNKSETAPAAAVSTETLDDLRDYARSLLGAVHDPGVGCSRIRLPIEALDQERDRERDEAGGLSGCRQAVEMLTRNPKKASYDVNKDGVKVAVLTFTKSAYRLGETVLGVVELNERASRARVLKLSAMLEAHESLPGSISSAPNSRHTRRVHAEHHSSFMPSTLRTTFSLDIPPDASPAFQVGISEDVSGKRGVPLLGGLEWKVRLCLLVAVASPTACKGPDGLQLRQLVRDGPRGEWGASWRAPQTIAPMERPDLHIPGSEAGGTAANTPSTALSWVSFFTTSLLGPASEFHDGDEMDEAVDEAVDGEGNEEDWRDVRAEMVECEVPIRVWPGNTAFKATDVVFEV